jgi:hypothetical protein
MEKKMKNKLLYGIFGAALMLLEEVFYCSAIQWNDNGILSSNQKNGHEVTQDTNKLYELYECYITPKHGSTAYIVADPCYDLMPWLLEEISLVQDGNAMNIIENLLYEIFHYDRPDNLRINQFYEGSCDEEPTNVSNRIDACCKKALEALDKKNPDAAEYLRLRRDHWCTISAGWN